MAQEKNKIILLHACCAICSAYPIEMLKNLGYEVKVYFYNPNIFPQEEYYCRLDAERKLCKYFGVELIEGEYNPEDFYKFVKGFEAEPEKGARCPLCFELRLKATAQKAKELGIGIFTTSIVISPHKNFELLSKIGDEIAKFEGLEYLDIDFKKKNGFLRTNNIAKSLSLYRQKYCGCKFSLRG